MGCGQDSPLSFAANPPPVVQRLQAEWESHPDRYKGKTESGTASSAVATALHREIEAGSLEEIQRYVEANGARQDPPEIATLLETHLIFEFMRSGDRSRLVRLLAAVPSDLSSYWSIEDRLTRTASWNAITDGMTALFDAFSAAKTREARESVYMATWRAFGDAPLLTKDPSAYMRAARPWYEAHKTRLVRCQNYDHMDLVMLRGGAQFEVAPCHLYSVNEPDSPPK